MSFTNIPTPESIINAKTNLKRVKRRLINMSYDELTPEGGRIKFQERKLKSFEEAFIRKIFKERGWNVDFQYTPSSEFTGVATYETIPYGAYVCHLNITPRN